jgi:hypothetical protein
MSLGAMDSAAKVALARKSNAATTNSFVRIKTQEDVKIQFG